MPNKIQCRLLSHSGELLNVVTCHAGRISVLRSSSPSELRPYQRALSGSAGKDLLQVLCDGVQFRPAEHSLIGFGEVSPTSGLSVKEFLSHMGLTEEAHRPLLQSVGLDDIITKRCSDLSAEQEARLRLVAATSDPSKALILNDPFEHISGQWRERIAELLVSYVETQKALVVIPSLSYRPESWVNNQIIERIEVGQTSQGTIGFGSAGSASNLAMTDLINKVREDPRFASQTTKREQGVGDVLAGATLGLSSSSATPDTSESTNPFARRSIFKVSGILLGTGLTAWMGLMITGVVPHRNPQTTPSVLGNHDSPQKGAPVTGNAHLQAPELRGAQAKDAAPSQQELGLDTTAASLGSSNPALSTAFVLDLYPAMIKASLLDTIKGTNTFSSSSAASSGKDSSASGQPPSGNLFALLEKASNSASQGPTYQEPPPGPDYADENELDDSASYVEPSEEEAKREEIRNRFLEAIQAAAARRQPSLGEEE